MRAPFYYRPEMARPPQAHRPDLPLERPQEFHRPLQRQLALRRREDAQGGRQRVRHPRLHVRDYRRDPPRDRHGSVQDHPGQERLRVRHGCHEVSVYIRVI